VTDARTVVALAGRRIDAPNAAEPRFPASQVNSVRDRIRSFLAASRAVALVASAACGADLIALQLAAEAKLRRRIVLPFDAVRFRETSVVDRGEEWGEIFDAVLRSIPQSDLIVLGLTEDEDAYTRTNVAILDHAQLLAGPGRDVRALVVWNGVPRGPDDITAQFASTARARNLVVSEVLTVPARPA
jgi:hypothetical protein